MDELLESRLREVGDEFQEQHDEETIQRVVEHVEAIEAPESEETANLLRILGGIE